MITGGTLAFVVTIAFMALFGSIGHSLILYFTLVQDSPILGFFYFLLMTNSVSHIVILSQFQTDSFSVLTGPSFRLSFVRPSAVRIRERAHERVEGFRGTLSVNQ